MCSFSLSVWIDCATHFSALDAEQSKALLVSFLTSLVCATQSDNPDQVDLLGHQTQMNTFSPWIWMGQAYMFDQLTFYLYFYQNGGSKEENPMQTA